jgi:hypothetical protein
MCPPFGGEFPPQSFVGVELIDQSLNRSLFGWEVIVRVHDVLSASRDRMLTALDQRSINKLHRQRIDR